MKNIISKETESNLSKLGFYQIIGGTVGILLVLWGLINSSQLTSLSVLLYFLIVFFFGYSIFCGALCLLTKKNALAHSLANQILQVFGFAVGGYAFNYVAGLYLTIEADFVSTANFSFGVGISSFKFYINNDQGQFLFSLNIVAVLIIYWIDKLMNKVKEEVAIRQISSLGEN